MRKTAKKSGAQKGSKKPVMSNKRKGVEIVFDKNTESGEVVIAFIKDGKCIHKDKRANQAQADKYLQEYKATGEYPVASIILKPKKSRGKGVVDSDFEAEKALAARQDEERQAEKPQHDVEEEKELTPHKLANIWEGREETSSEFMERRRKSGLTAFNQHMQDYIMDLVGIKVSPKFIESGSLKGSWRLVSKTTPWYGNSEVQDKMSNAGFTDHTGAKLSDLSGNGGLFSMFVKFTMVKVEAV